MSPLQRFQVLLTPDQLAALRQLEQRTGASVGAHIRLAVDQYLRLAVDQYLDAGDKKRTARAGKRAKRS